MGIGVGLNFVRQSNIVPWRKQGKKIIENQGSTDGKMAVNADLAELPLSLKIEPANDKKSLSVFVKINRKK